mmetsp:Transcript_30089/g.75736  ORF Transcript_30089/g.75736 Transcript_30089/m.75736 type:complete len:341 (+) Transcript_30089:590-1612(+)
MPNAYRSNRHNRHNNSGSDLRSQIEHHPNSMHRAPTTQQHRASSRAPLLPSLPLPRRPPPSRRLPRHWTSARSCMSPSRGGHSSLPESGTPRCWPHTPNACEQLPSCTNAWPRHNSNSSNNNNSITSSPRVPPSLLAFMRRAAPLSAAAHRPASAPRCMIDSRTALLIRTAPRTAFTPPIAPLPPTEGRCTRPRCMPPSRARITVQPSRPHAQDQPMPRRQTSLSPRIASRRCFTPSRRIVSRCRRTPLPRTPPIQLTLRRQREQCRPPHRPSPLPPPHRAAIPCHRNTRMTPLHHLCTLTAATATALLLLHHHHLHHHHHHLLYRRRRQGYRNAFSPSV